MELVMTSVRQVETLEEFEQRVVRLQAEFASGDAAIRRRLLQPAHAKERFGTTIRRRRRSPTQTPAC
jgi:hypothetical protein